MLPVTLFLLAIAVWGQSAPGKTEHLSEASALQGACKAVLTAIEANRPKGLTPYLADGGIALGAGKAPTPKKDILHELGAKQGFYCRVFDSSCLPKQDGKAQATSYREEITKASSEFATCTPDIHAKGQTGTLVVVLNKRKPQEKRLILEFTLEKKQWKLSGLPQY